MPGKTHRQVLIVGGGTAGITVAAILKRRAPQTDIAVVEPAPEHYYQPAFTLVGAGLYPLAQDAPRGAELDTLRRRLDSRRRPRFRTREEHSSPEERRHAVLRLSRGLYRRRSRLEQGRRTIRDPRQERGVQQLFARARDLYAGLPEGLQARRPAGVHAAAASFQMPRRASEDRLSRRRRSSPQGNPERIAAWTSTRTRPAIFGVPFFARELVKIAARYGIEVHYQQNLVAVDGAAKTATFEMVGEQRKGERVTVPFDMLHVTPPQSPAEEIRSSPLANAAGWVEVNQNTMQHVRYPNVFALGDVASSPNSKTAAAVRKQAPVVVANILRLMAKDGSRRRLRRLRLLPADHGERQGDSCRVHLRREGDADLAARPREGALDRLVDQAHRPPADVLALYAQGVRLVSQAQHRLQG